MFIQNFKHFESVYHIYKSIIRKKKNMKMKRAPLNCIKIPDAIEVFIT